MKKTITYFGRLAAACFALLAPMAATEAQTPSGAARIPAQELRSVPTLRPIKNLNYKPKDINGREYDMAATLSSGKCILIDFSATWCDPCWNIHNRGVLDEIYKKFGPSGTNQMELWWVEVSGASVDKIKDPKRDWTVDRNGNPVPYSVFGDKQMPAELGISASTVPTFALLGPGGEWVYCDEAVKNAGSNYLELKQLMTLFLTMADKPNKPRFELPEYLFVGESIRVDAKCVTVAPLTDVAWTVSDGLTVSDPGRSSTMLSCTKPGVQMVRVTMANKNGAVSVEKEIEVRSGAIGSFPFYCSMEDREKIDFGWRSVDLDGDGLGFETWGSNAARLGAGDLPLGANGTKGSLVSWTTAYPLEILSDGSVVSEPIDADNMLVSAPILIDANASAPLFSFWIDHFFVVDNPDRASVWLSTTGELSREGFATQLGSPQASDGKNWKQIIADLSDYKGQQIWLAVIPEVQGGSALMVDELCVSMDGSTAVRRPSAAGGHIVYPNPADEVVSVQTEEALLVELFASDGRLLLSQRCPAGSTPVATAAYPSGRYLLRLTPQDGTPIVRSLLIDHRR